MNNQQIMQLQQAQKFNQVINSLTDQCWDMCVSNPGHSLDSKTQNCLSNCVERFLDTAKHVSGQMDVKARQLSQSGSHGGEDMGSELKWN